MTDARVSRVDGQALVANTASVRLSRVATEVLYSLPPTAVQMSRAHLDVLVLPTSSEQVSAARVEVLMTKATSGTWVLG